MSFFSRASFAFLRELRENNSREWFEANRDRYEKDLRAPAQRLIVAVGDRLDAVSPQLRADPRGNGGSLFRIHRDVRFSRDKSPYKTHAGIQFRHAAGKNAHAPGVYLHVEPRSCFLGLGVWRPESAALKQIRTRIAEGPAEWTEATRNGRFTGAFELSGESLKTHPRGFDPAHPLLDDLRRKDFIAVRPMTQGEVTSERLPDQIIELGQIGTPLMAFLCRAIGVPF